MTLGKLILFVAIAALVLTVAIGLVSRRVKNWPISFLQNFVGILFIVSGYVKAVDPLGTAYKLEQYFAEFESVFQGTWFSFLGPLFPWLSEYAIGFSVFMIVFEIVLGIMLVIGSARKFTAWAFLILVVFFTFLTGFTYLTGYVPDGVNFFQFGQWGAYVETNMKVTDCGCFGDFLKLEPFTSFLKDVVLLVPGILFVVFHASKHQLFTPFARTAITVLSVVGLTFYSMSNYLWDIPHTDFRPFQVGVNIAERKALEEEAAANVEIIAYRMTNKESGKAVELPYEQYLKEYKDYPKEEWELEQVQSEPAVPHTKISEFEVSDTDGNDVTEEILSDPGYAFMIVAYGLKGTEEEGVRVENDTIFAVDTIPSADTFYTEKRVERIENRQVQTTEYYWKESYVEPWTEIVNPVLAAAQAEGVGAYAITSFAAPEKLESFRAAIGADYPFYVADDILLKTIVRSNPGLVLIKNGEIIQKWHYKKLPDFQEIKARYLRPEAGEE